MHHCFMNAARQAADHWSQLQTSIGMQHSIGAHLKCSKIDHLQTSPAQTCRCQLQRSVPAGTRVPEARCRQQCQQFLSQKNRKRAKQNRVRSFACDWSVRATATDEGLSSSDADYEQLLHSLEQMSLPELRQYFKVSAEEISLPFMTWLASREDDLEEPAKLKLSVLAGQLMALREGLDPCTYEEVADDLQQSWEAQAGQQQLNANKALPPRTSTETTKKATQQPTEDPSQPRNDDAEDPGSTASDPDSYASSAAVLRQRFADARSSSAADLLRLQPFSAAGITQQYEQAKLLQADMKQAKATSTARLIGRKKINLDEWLKAASPSSTAERIMEFLLDLPSAEARREVLPEAFAAPDDAGQTDQANAASDSETEQLSTTPLQLLQAIDLALGRLSRPSSQAQSSAKALPGEHITDMEGALQELRLDTLRLWDGGK